MASLLSPYLLGPAQPMAAQPQQSGLSALLGNMGQSDRAMRLKDILAPEIALPMAGAMFMGETPQQSFGGALQMAGLGFGQKRQEREETTRRNKTAELLRKSNPELLPWLEAGAISPVDAFNAIRASGKTDLTDDLKEYQYAIGQGYQGSFTQYMTEMRKAGATTVDARQMGTVPPGYRAEYDEQGRVVQMVLIPGGPAAAEVEAAEGQSNARMDAAMTASDTVTQAAQRARTAVGNQNFGSGGTTAVAKIPIVGPLTDSAEVVRQTDVLKSLAAAENLNAMRQSSPTGGALGNVTEKELKLLQDKSGALDPNSPTFIRDLEDYERTLLRTIHGREVGDAIFEQTRRQGGNRTFSGVQWSVE
ncbi:hypothetical protein [Mesorhizobium sp. Z1-4]|uniref:hypothetical protein n=1 Tax=Mesorhizobium sp. Z1-4 TaxID=2448478 RepID=UPI000FDC40E9|nr:hypothetical protein [Mesorhizobium sp. Z1-4]